MAPTGTQVQVAIGAGWLALGLYWLYRSTIVASSMISLLFCLVCCLAAGANGYLLYRRGAFGTAVVPTFRRSAPSGSPEPARPSDGAQEQAPEFTQIRPVASATQFTQARWSAPSTQPISMPPEAPAGQQASQPPDPVPGWAPAPVWAPSPRVAPAPPRLRQPNPPYQPDPQAESRFQPWPPPPFPPGPESGPEHQPEPRPEPDPDQKWRRPRRGRS